MVALVGATGMVGQTMVDVLVERNFPMADLKLLASARSKDLKIKAGDREYPVEEAMPRSCAGVDIAFFSAGEAISKELASEAVAAGRACHRQQQRPSGWMKRCPWYPRRLILRLPMNHRGIIANPNCSTIQMVVAPAAVQAGRRIEKGVAANLPGCLRGRKEAVDE